MAELRAPVTRFPAPVPPTRPEYIRDVIAGGRLQLLSTDLQMAPLTFTASWLASPDTVAVERVAELAASLAQKAHVVDARLRARH